MHKRREGISETRVTHLVGDVRGRQPIVIDDIMASGSVLGQIPELFKQGARPEVHLAITHPVLLPSAMSRLDADWVTELVTISSTRGLPW